MKKTYLIIIAVIALLIGLFALSAERNTAVRMAQSIIAKDKFGDNNAAELTKLTDYVHNHSRTGVTFVLEGSYQRAVKAAQQAAVPKSNPNVYAAAQAACNSKNPVAMANCIQSYVQSHASPGAQPQPVVLPAIANYTYRLNAPAWAPDITGISFLVAVVALLTAAWLFVFGLVNRPSY